MTMCLQCVAGVKTESGGKSVTGRRRTVNSAFDYLRGDGIYSNREQFPMPVLIFLDLKLPYYTGFDILEWMRTQPHLASIVVVILTGSAESRDKDKAYSLGARSYLVKPPTPVTLTAILDSLNTLWRSKSPNTPAFSI